MDEFARANTGQHYIARERQSHRLRWNWRCLMRLANAFFELMGALSKPLPPPRRVTRQRVDCRASKAGIKRRQTPGLQFRRSDYRHFESVNPSRRSSRASFGAFIVCCTFAPGQGLHVISDNVLMLEARKGGGRWLVKVISRRRLHVRPLSCRLL